MTKQTMPFIISPLYTCPRPGTMKLIAAAAPASRDLVPASAVASCRWRLTGSRNSPQCRHFLALAMIVSAQNGQDLVATIGGMIGVGALPSTNVAWHEGQRTRSPDTGLAIWNGWLQRGQMARTATPCSGRNRRRYLVSCRERREALSGHQPMAYVHHAGSCRCSSSTHQTCQRPRGRLGPVLFVLLRWYL